MATYVSKPLFIKWFILLLILTPIIFGISMLVLAIIFGPFLENRFTLQDTLCFSAIISFFLVILSVWVPFISSYKIDNSDNRKKIEQISRVVSDFNLNYEEAELINRVEGWDYKNVIGDRLNKEDLKEALVLSRKNQIEKESYHKWRNLTGIIISFIMISIFAVGRLFIFVAFFLLIILYFNRRYRRHLLNIKKLNDEIQKLKT